MENNVRPAEGTLRELQLLEFEMLKKVARAEAAAEQEDQPVKRGRRSGKAREDEEVAETPAEEEAFEAPAEEAEEAEAE